jgi:tight adherence protein B
VTTVILLGFVSLALFVLALYQWWVASAETTRIAKAVIPENSASSLLSQWSALDRFVLSTRWGPTVQSTVLAAGIPLTPGRFVLIIAFACVLLGMALGNTLSWLLFPLGPLLVLYALRFYVDRQREQRREAFIAQMPELARTLSNGSSAGLSVRTSIAMAADELAEPAATELREVTEQLNLGGSLDDALTAMEKRLPSKEVATLVSSLIVSARSGGALVSALRDIAETLELRRELRREIRTTYAQTVATAYTVLGMGVLTLFMLENIQPGSIDAMLRSPIGQAAMVGSAAVYAGGIWIVRRMTRVDI